MHIWEVSDQNIEQQKRDSPKAGNHISILVRNPNPCLHERLVVPSKKDECKRRPCRRVNGRRKGAMGDRSVDA